MQAHEVITIKKQLNYSGVGGGAQAVNLPEVKVSCIEMVIDYTVTDAGISAGETFEGVIDTLLVGSDRYKIIEAQRDDLSLLVDFLTPGISTGKYSDPVPTTAVAQKAHFCINAPEGACWDLSAGGGRNQFRLILRPATDEWGGASAFVANVTLYLHVCPGSHEVPVRVARVYGATTTDQRLVLPDDMHIVAAYLVAGDDDLDEISIGSEFSTSYAYGFHSHYAAYKTAAPDAAPRKYLVDHFLSPAQPNRNLITKSGSTTTLEAFILGV